MLDDIAKRFGRIAPRVDFWSLRLVDTRYEGLSVRQNILQPLNNVNSTGACVTIIDGNGMGYAATSDVTQDGLAKAVHHAKIWARSSAIHGLVGVEAYARPNQSGSYQTHVDKPWTDWTLGEKISLLHDANRALKKSDVIVDWSASLSHQQDDILLISSDAVRIEQSFSFFTPGMVAVANLNADTQRRTWGYHHARQGGLELIQERDFLNKADKISDEALQLLYAPPCPVGQMDLLLMPGQMVLQIHESIGHPLELDRILGDERNYAGTSFVTLDMFGQYPYGSELLNVTFDPTLGHQLASYGYDDEGTPAEHQYIIRNGILQRPLGSVTSQARAGLSGVANARASDWNRPPIDRMSNLNLEPGPNTLDAMIASIDKGILMDTNRSWSIDDSRNKFQFGCEIGYAIEKGELKHLVKNANYRGISATFWRSLAMVGNDETFEVLGVSNCGKGEPNQAIKVGHASPACVFNNVDVFGGV
jgi:predicted Zn-dependent protease